MALRPAIAAAAIGCGPRPRGFPNVVEFRWARRSSHAAAAPRGEPLTVVHDFTKARAARRGWLPSLLAQYDQLDAQVLDRAARFREQVQEFLDEGKAEAGRRPATAAGAARGRAERGHYV